MLAAMKYAGYDDGVEDLLFPVCIRCGQYEVVSGPAVHVPTELRPVPLTRIALESRPRQPPRRCAGRRQRTSS